MALLLKPQEVAGQVRCSVRKLKDLPIPIVRIGRNRLYDPKDVARYIEACKECTSTMVSKLGCTCKTVRISDKACHRPFTNLVCR